MVSNGIITTCTSDDDAAAATSFLLVIEQVIEIHHVERGKIKFQTYDHSGNWFDEVFKDF